MSPTYVCMYVQGICVVDAYIFQFFASISTTDFIHVVKCSAVVGFSAGLSCDKSAKKKLVSALHSACYRVLPLH